MNDIFSSMSYSKYTVLYQHPIVIGNNISPQLGNVASFRRDLESYNNI